MRTTADGRCSVRADGAGHSHMQTAVRRRLSNLTCPSTSFGKPERVKKRTASAPPTAPSRSSSASANQAAAGLAMLGAGDLTTHDTSQVLHNSIKRAPAWGAQWLSPCSGHRGCHQAPTFFPLHTSSEYAPARRPQPAASRALMTMTVTGLDQRLLAAGLGHLLCIIRVYNVGHVVCDD